MNDGPQDTQGPEIADKPDRDQVISGTDWFLAGEVTPIEPVPFDVNVAPVGRPRRWVRLRIEPIRRDLVKQIRIDATDETTGREDDMKANVFICVQSLVDPDLTREDVRHGMADPADALSRMFGHKGMLIDRIANKVLQLSGQDPDDVRDAPKNGVDADLVNAAGKS